MNHLESDPVLGNSFDLKVLMKDRQAWLGRMLRFLYHAILTNGDFNGYDDLGLSLSQSFLQAANTFSYWSVEMLHRLLFLRNTTLTLVVISVGMDLIKVIDQSLECQRALDQMLQPASALRAS